MKTDIYLLDKTVRCRRFLYGMPVTVHTQKCNESCLPARFPGSNNGTQKQILDRWNIGLYHEDGTHQPSGVFRT